MKVKDLSSFLEKLDPEENICALIYDKSIFVDIHEEDGMILPDAAWEQICNQFDDSPFNDIWESINMAVVDSLEDA